MKFTGKVVGGAIGLLTLLIGTFSLLLASRKSPVPVTHGEQLPFRDVMVRVAPHGFGLALGGVGFSAKSRPRSNGKPVCARP